MSSVKFFFLGFVADEDLHARLENCSDSDRDFLNDPSYLEQITVGDITYIGRRMDAEAVGVSGVEDSARNVASLISRVAPGWSKPASGAVFSALEEEISTSDLVIDT